MSHSSIPVATTRRSVTMDTSKPPTPPADVPTPPVATATAASEPETLTTRFTDEECEALKTMTPREKKVWLAKRKSKRDEVGQSKMLQMQMGIMGKDENGAKGRFAAEMLKHARTVDGFNTMNKKKQSQWAFNVINKMYADGVVTPEFMSEHKEGALGVHKDVHEYAERVRGGERTPTGNALVDAMVSRTVADAEALEAVGSSESAEAGPADGPATTGPADDTPKKAKKRYE